MDAYEFRRLMRKLLFWVILTLSVYGMLLIGIELIETIHDKLINLKRL